jgi:hypothetical protein
MIQQTFYGLKGVAELNSSAGVGLANSSQKGQLFLSKKSLLRGPFSSYALHRLNASPINSVDSNDNTDNSTVSGA